MAIDMFFVWLGAAVIMLFAFHFTRNWTTNYVGELPTSVVHPPDGETLLHHKIAKLQHECNEMEGVMVLYNNDYVRQEYWDMKQQLQNAEVELQTKYGHSRKVVPNFRRV